MFGRGVPGWKHRVIKRSFIIEHGGSRREKRRNEVEEKEDEEQAELQRFMG